MVLSFLLNVFSIWVFHCLKSVGYKKVCVCLCVCVAGCASVCMHVCVLKDVSKIKVIWFL